MKKMAMIMVLGLFLAGCGAAVKESGYYDHSSHYKSWSHLAFSWFGYNHVTEEAADASAAQKWWGISYARH
jgi:hypothetical protein